MMNDYAAWWPFWGDDGGCPDRDPALPPQLAADVRAWAAHFERCYSHETGWPSETAADQHRRRAAELFQAVKSVLEVQGHSVELVLWETGDRD